MASKRGIEAGRAYVKGWFDDSAIVRGLKRTTGRIQSFGRMVGKIGAATFGTGLLAGAAGLNKVLDSIGQTDQINKIAKAFGLATEQASGLMGVFSAAGADNARENIESLVTMSSMVQQALTGEGQGAKLFEGLSVSAQELSKLSLDEQFFRLHAAIKELPNPVDRVNKLMLAFGEDGGKTLIGTLAKSTDELRAQAASLKITAEEAEQASESQAAMNRASAAFGAMWRSVASTVAPAIEVVSGWLEKMAKWLAKSGTAQAIAGIVAALTALGGVGAVVGTAIAGIAAGATALASFIAAAWPVILGLAAGAVYLAAWGAAVYYVAKRTGILASAMEWFAATFGPLVAIVKRAFAAIKLAITNGDIAGAWRVLLDTLGLIAVKGVAFILGKWIDLKEGIYNTFSDLGGSLGKLWNAIIDYLRNGIANFANTLANLPQMVANAVRGVSTKIRESADFVLPEIGGGAQSFDAQRAGLNRWVAQYEQQLTRSIATVQRRNMAPATAPPAGPQGMPTGRPRRQPMPNLKPGGWSQAWKDAAARNAELRRREELLRRQHEAEQRRREEGHRAAGSQLPDLRQSATLAANTALHAGSPEGVAAVLNAMRPRTPKVTEGEKTIAAKIDKTNAMLKKIEAGKLIVGQTKGR